MSLDDLNQDDATLGQADGEADLQDALTANSEFEFVASPKKPVSSRGILLFVLVLAGAAVIYFMYFRKGPASAEAAAANVEAVKAKETISQFLGDGKGNIAMMEQMLRNTEKVVQQFLNYPSQTQVPLKDLQTNPFRELKLKVEPTANESESAARRRREEERQAALKAVQGLQLQSIISGTRKACMINGTLYTEGQGVDGMVIERISPDGVIVRSGAYRFELKMQQ